MDKEKIRGRSFELCKKRAVDGDVRDENSSSCVVRTSLFVLGFFFFLLLPHLDVKKEKVSSSILNDIEKTGNDV